MIQKKIQIVLTFGILLDEILAFIQPLFLGFRPSNQ